MQPRSPVERVALEPSASFPGAGPSEPIRRGAEPLPPSRSHLSEAGTPLVGGRRPRVVIAGRSPRLRVEQLLDHRQHVAGRDQQRPTGRERSIERHLGQQLRAQRERHDEHHRERDERGKGQLGAGELRPGLRRRDRRDDEAQHGRAAERPHGDDPGGVLRRRQGKEPVTYLHPSLQPALEETMGVILYQEQVMKIAIDVAGFSAAESDGFRRAMGTWRSSKEMEKLHARFVDGCIARNGLTIEQAEELFRQVAAFASFGFNKSHAAAFARTGFSVTISLAFLSVRRPLKLPCRTRPPPVQPRNATSAISSGFTKCARRPIAAGTEIIEILDQMESLPRFPFIDDVRPPGGAPG